MDTGVLFSVILSVDSPSVAMLGDMRSVNRQIPAQAASEGENLLTPALLCRSACSVSLLTSGI